MPDVFMFAGQGTQYAGMGAELYRENSRFRAHLEELDSRAVEYAGVSVMGLITRSDVTWDELAAPRESSFAIFILELALFKTLLEYGLVPRHLMGSSLGLFAAGAAAGAICTRTAIAMLCHLVEVIEKECQPGRMIGVLAAPAVYYNSSLLQATSEMAAVNFDASFVLAVPGEHVEAVCSHLKQNDVVFTVIPTSAPFHSRWIDVARRSLVNHFSKLRFEKPNFSVFCCSATGIVDAFDAEVFWRAIRGQLHIKKTVLSIEATGPYRYIDVGPSGALATSVKYCLPAGSPSKPVQILNPFRRDVRNMTDLLSTTPARSSL